MGGGQPLAEDSAISWWNDLVGNIAVAGCAEGHDEVDALPASEGGPVGLVGILLFILFGQWYHFVDEENRVGG